MFCKRMLVLAAMFVVVFNGLLGCAGLQLNMPEREPRPISLRKDAGAQISKEENSGLVLLHTPEVGVVAEPRPKSLTTAPREATSVDGATEAGNLVFWLVFILGALMLVGSR